MAEAEKGLGKQKIEKGEYTDEQLDEVSRGEYKTVKQVAQTFVYHRAWITTLIKQKRIRAIKPLGGQWRIPNSEFERLKREGIPPMPREPAEKLSPIELQVSEELEEKITDKKRTDEGREGPPGIFPFPFDFSIGRGEK